MTQDPRRKTQDPGPKTALITGASSGIGLELAKIHAESGGSLVLVARREDRLLALKAALEQRHDIHVEVVVQDLARECAAERLVDALGSRALHIDYLINNAGFGGLGFFHEQSWNRNRAMIQVNISSLVGLTQLLLPAMIEKRAGRILNVASTAGFMPGPLHAVYYATKAFVLSFSEALASELSGTGVSVTTLCPGFTETEFQEVGQTKNTGASNAGALPAETVARFGYTAMLQGKGVVVPGLTNKAVAVMPRLLPRKAVTALSRKAKKSKQ